MSPRASKPVLGERYEGKLGRGGMAMVNFVRLRAMPRLLDRLRERKVVEWGLAYLGGAWLTLEVTRWPPPRQLIGAII